MQLRNYIFIILLINSISTFSQELHFSRGGKIEDFNDTFTFFTQDSSCIYAYCCNNRQYFLHSFDKKTLGKLSRVKIPLPSKDTTNYVIEGIYVRNDTFQVFYSYFKLLDKKQMLEMITFDKSGSKIGEKVVVDEQEGKNPKRTAIRVIHRKKAGEYLTTGYNVKKDTIYISIDHFDYTGLLKYAQNVYVAGSATDFTIDENCNLYYLTNRKIKRGNVQWKVQVFSTGTDSAVSVSLPKLSAGNIFLSQFSRTLIEKDILNYFIPYSVDGGANATGIYFVQIDCKSKTLLKEETIHFKEKTNEYNGFEMMSSIITNIIPCSDNRFKIIFESRTSTDQSVYGIKIATDYTIGNIVTLDIDSNCRVTEFHNIKKEQISNQSKFMYTGFAAFQKEDECYFLYNELPGNLSKPASDMKKVNMSKIDETNVIYTFVEDGKVSRKTLIDKGTEPGIDAIIPSNYLFNKAEHKLYLVRKIKDEAELLEVY